MILHLGGDAVVPMEDIIAIMDIKVAEQTSSNQEFMSIAKEEGFVRQVSDDPPKSFVLAEVDKKNILFLSPISSVTLLKRSRSVMTTLFDEEENKGDIK